MKTGYDQFFQKAKETSKTQNLSNFRQLQKQKINSKKKKSLFPIKQFLLFGLVSFVGLFIFEHSEDIETQLRKVEIGLPFASAEEHKPEATQKNEAAHVGAEKPSDVKEAKAEKPDEADYLFKLADRKKQLDVREEELNKYAAEIKKQKEEIEEKLKKLEETRQKISTALEDKIKTDDAKVDTLVQMYSNMKPQQAAKVFETLEEDLVIEILSRMKKKSAADILNLIKPEKAQILAERYAGYRVPASK